MSRSTLRQLSDQPGAPPHAIALLPVAALAYSVAAVLWSWWWWVAAAAFAGFWLVALHHRRWLRHHLREIDGGDTEGDAEAGELH